LSYEWSDLDSTTGDYTFWAQMTFGYFPAKKESVDVRLPWVQACHVDIADISIVNFTAADYDLSTEAYATIFAKGSIAGDCGSNNNLAAYLDELDS